jgi:hypothetical protein
VPSERLNGTDVTLEANSNTPCRSALIHTCHAVPLPCRAPTMPCPCHAVLLQCRAPAISCPCHAVPLPCRAPAMPGPCHAVPLPCRAPAMPCPCHAVPLPCRAALIHTSHAVPLSLSDIAVSFVKVHVVAGNIRTASPRV